MKFGVTEKIRVNERNNFMFANACQALNFLTFNSPTLKTIMNKIDVLHKPEEPSQVT